MALQEVSSYWHKYPDRIFVHDDPVRGFHITKLLDGKVAYRPPAHGRTILRYVDAIRLAKEIHCMDSSFYHLVESLSNMEGIKLFLHRYVRWFPGDWTDYPMRYDWSIVS